MLIYEKKMYSECTYYVMRTNQFVNTKNKGKKLAAKIKQLKSFFKIDVSIQR